MKKALKHDSTHKTIILMVDYITEIGDIAGVAEVTIRQAYKQMYPRAHDLFPADYKFFTPVEQLPTQ